MPRLGIYTGSPTYERAAFLIEGFDLARGSRVGPLLNVWVQDRFGETSVGWPWVLLRLSLDIPRDVDGPDLGGLNLYENETALALLREVLGDVVKAF